MNSEEQTKKYYTVKQNKPPSFLLKEAMGFVINKNKALDLGAGALQDSKFILESGFRQVVIVDKSPLVKEYANGLSGIDIQISHFEDFDFIPENFDLISAQWSLPFCNPIHFNRAFKDIIGSLKTGAIFTGQLFGVNDEWNANQMKKEQMTFHTKEEVYSILNGLEIIKLIEKEEDSKTALGVLKHWHVFHIIARKIN